MIYFVGMSCWHAFLVYRDIILYFICFILIIILPFLFSSLGEISIPELYNTGKFRKALLSSQRFCFWCFCMVFRNTVTCFSVKSWFSFPPQFWPGPSLLFISVLFNFDFTGNITLQSEVLSHKEAFAGQFWEWLAFMYSTSFKPLTSSTCTD